MCAITIIIQFLLNLTFKIILITKPIQNIIEPNVTKPMLISCTLLYVVISYLLTEK